MNILFVTAHPAQVHNFRLVRELLLSKGHNVFWLTTPKDIATNLLDVYGIPYEIIQKSPKSFVGRVWYMLKNLLFLLPYLKKNKIDLVVDRYEPFITVAAWLSRTPHICLADTEHAAKICKPLLKMCDHVFIPDCFYEPILKNMSRFAGNIELFYCHPRRYNRNEPWTLLDIPENTSYVIVRFVKWDAYHDVKLVGGFSVEQKIKLIQSLSKNIKVFISAESDLPKELEQYRINIPIERMHDVLSFSSLFIGESASMASEAVVLGTPAIYIDEIGRGYTDEEAREGLLCMYRPVENKSGLRTDEKKWISGGVEECIAKAEEMISGKFNYEEWNDRHKRWMDTKIDCTKWLAWIIEKYPESVSQWKDLRSTLETNFK